MSEWNNYKEVQPPETSISAVKWYEVKLADGSISQACWWVNHWYCFADWMYVIEWREIE